MREGDSSHLGGCPLSFAFVPIYLKSDVGKEGCSELVIFPFSKV